MLYIALTLWLFVILVVAWGVHRQWAAMVRPRVLNAVLLPGTLVAHVGHALGLLIAGGNLADIGPACGDEDDAPETPAPATSRLPTLGPVVLGLLPFLACAVGIYVVVRWLGGPFLLSIKQEAIGPEVPTTLAGFWQLLRDQITLAESTLHAVTMSDFGDWRTWVFVYLAACLAVQLAPFRGNLRGALIATIVLGVCWASLGSLVDVLNPMGHEVWPIMNLILGTLLVLLLVALLFRGGFGLFRVLRTNR